MLSKQDIKISNLEEVSAILEGLADSFFKKRTEEYDLEKLITPRWRLLHKLYSRTHVAARSIAYYVKNAKDKPLRVLQQGYELVETDLMVLRLLEDGQNRYDTELEDLKLVKDVLERYVPIKHQSGKMLGETGSYVQQNSDALADLLIPLMVERRPGVIEHLASKNYKELRKYAREIKKGL